jgi:hypothetical protein
MNRGVPHVSKQTQFVVLRVQKPSALQTLAEKRLRAWPLRNIVGDDR